jgi:hypothetical protein
MKSTLSFLIVLLSSNIYSQEAVISAGGNFTGTGGSSSYTIGQISYNTITDSSQSIAQGVQQPVEIQLLSDSDFLSKNSKVLIYPNPTSENIFLEFSEHQISDCAYLLYDTKGQELGCGVIKDSITPINIKNFANGIYFLKVTKQNISNIVFKIIKQ